MKLFTLTLLLCLSNLGKAQQHYHFVETADTYTDLEDPISDPDVHVDEDFLFYIYPELEGETFNFFGEDFTFSEADVFFGIRTLGNLRMQGTTSVIIIDGLWTEFDSLDANSTLVWAVEGDPGSYVVKVQWKNVGIRPGPPGNYANFQMWVHQETGIIEFRYGPVSANNLDAYTDDNGPYFGIFHANPSFTTMNEKIWLSGHPSDLDLDTNATFAFGRMTGIPEEGTVYRFIPKELVTGLEENNSAMEIYIYPTPANDKLNIFNVENLDITNLSIYDASGKLVKDSLAQTSIIDVSDLPEGNYILNLNTNKGIIVQRFIISR